MTFVGRATGCMSGMYMASTPQVQTCACLCGSYLSPQWSVPRSPSYKPPSSLNLEDSLVLFALAFNVSTPSHSPTAPSSHHPHVAPSAPLCFWRQKCDTAPQIVFVFGIEMVYLNAQPSQDKKQEVSRGAPAAAFAAGVARGGECFKRATSPKW